jgi:predicted unusual protein kinase regulating ubiquinone biosynthesis (AarF/ABC1/UbiB family)
VLTAAWVPGEKLSESSAADVRQLCNTLLNAYLIQLLDTGFLHADPHPGNLLRTPDGRICVLDFGLMTEVRGHMAAALAALHLTSRARAGCRHRSSGHTRPQTLAAQMDDQPAVMMMGSASALHLKQRQHTSSTSALLQDTH